MINFLLKKKKYKYDIAFIITELGRFRYHDFVELLIRKYPNVRVHFILSPSLIANNNTYKNKADKTIKINEIVTSNYNRLFAVFAKNVTYHIINYNMINDNFNNKLKNKILDIFNLLSENSYVFFSDLDLSKILNKNTLKSNIKFIYTSYHSFYLLKNSLGWFILYPQLIDYYAVVVHHEIDKKYLLQPIKDENIKQKINNIVKIIDIPITRNRQYLQYKKNSYIIIVLHWSRFFSKAEQYMNSLVELVQKYPNEKFLIRLHPLFLRNLETKETDINNSSTTKKSSFLDKGFVEKFVNSFNPIVNVVFSLEESLTEILLDSKMLIIDGITMISDYFLSEKPIILLNDLKNPVSNVFNEFFSVIEPGIYDINNSKDLFQIFDNLICGIDVKHEIRKQISNNIFSKQIDSKLLDLLF